METATQEENWCQTGVTAWSLECAGAAEQIGNCGDTCRGGRGVIWVACERVRTCKTSVIIGEAEEATGRHSGLRGRNGRGAAIVSTRMDFCFTFGAIGGLYCGVGRLPAGRRRGG